MAPSSQHGGTIGKCTYTIAPNMDMTTTSTHLIAGERMPDFTPVYYTFEYIAADKVKAKIITEKDLFKIIKDSNSPSAAASVAPVIAAPVIAAARTGVGSSVLGVRAREEVEVDSAAVTSGNAAEAPTERPSKKARVDVSRTKMSPPNLGSKELPFGA